MIESDKTNHEFLDARGQEHFDKSHPYGFKCAHYSKYLDNDTSFKSSEEIKSLLDQEGIDIDKEMIFSCGGGVVACITETASIIAGATNTAIYDGSLQEYQKYGEPDFSVDNWEEKYPS